MAMDFHGVEWAIPLYQLLMLLLPGGALLVLYRRVRRGRVSRWGAWWRYALIVLAPVLLYLGLVLVLIGLEEVSDLRLLSEALGRSVLLVIAIGLLIWLAAVLFFAVLLGALKPRARRGRRRTKPRT